MSQSSRVTNSKESHDSYLAAWHATNKLLREGRSFSGRERNCVFLNCGTTRFANTSAVSGLGFADDGRAVAVTDWDGDGDVDLWLYNRTGPRLRLMRNETISAAKTSTANFIALKLQGTTCNRDAIGAQVEVVVDESNNDRHVQTVYAGDGYLSQSSKTLHVGLGTNSKIERINVTWPGGNQETFEDVQPGRQYRLVQGSGEALVTTARRPLSLIRPANQPDTNVPAAARFTLATPLPLPILQFRRDSKTSTRLEPAAKPMLLVIWASWCPSCVQELKLLTRQAGKIHDLDIEVVALSVDGLDDRKATTGNDAQRILASIDFPFVSGVASRELLDKLQLVQRIALNRPPTFSVPISFLIDAENRLANIYRGSLALPILRQDVVNLSANAVERRNLAVPFTGRWIGEPKNILLRAVAGEFQEQGYDNDYERYLELDVASIAEGRRLAKSPQERDYIDQQYATANFQMAKRLQSEGDLDNAIAFYRRGLTVLPNAARAHFYLGQALMEKDEADQAVEHYQQALAGDSALGEVRLELAKALLMQGQAVEAATHLRRLLAAEPDDLAARFQLGVTLAAQGDLPAAANAFKYVLRELPEHVDALANLGALQARQGELDEAIESFQEALTIDPAHVQARMNLGGALGSRGKFREAADHFRSVLKIDPTQPQAHARLGQASLKVDEPAVAVTHFQAAIEHSPGDVTSMLRLAWLWSTHPDEAIRDGKRAVELTQRLNKMTENREPRVLDTLAAAFAETGDFAQAVRIGRQSILVVPARDSDLRKAIEKRLQIYENGQPYRDPNFASNTRSR